METSLKLNRPFRVVYNEAKNLYGLQYRFCFIWWRAGYTQGSMAGDFFVPYLYSSLDEAIKGSHNIKESWNKDDTFKKKDFWKVVWP